MEIGAAYAARRYTDPHFAHSARRNRALLDGERTVRRVKDGGAHEGIVVPSCPRPAEFHERACHPERPKGAKDLKMRGLKLVQRILRSFGGSTPPQDDNERETRRRIPGIKGGRGGRENGGSDR